VELVESRLNAPVNQIVGQLLDPLLLLRSVARVTDKDPKWLTWTSFQVGSVTTQTIEYIFV
jgi:hypothetical protein